MFGRLSRSFKKIRERHDTGELSHFREGFDGRTSQGIEAHIENKEYVSDFSGIINQVLNTNVASIYKHTFTSTGVEDQFPSFALPAVFKFVSPNDIESIEKKTERSFPLAAYSSTDDCIYLNTVKVESLYKKLGFEEFATRFIHIILHELGHFLTLKQKSNALSRIVSGKSVTKSGAGRFEEHRSGEVFTYGYYLEEIINEVKTFSILLELLKSKDLPIEFRGHKTIFDSLKLTQLLEKLKTKDKLSSYTSGIGLLVLIMRKIAAETNSSEKEIWFAFLRGHVRHMDLGKLLKAGLAKDAKLQKTLKMMEMLNPYDRAIPIVPEGYEWFTVQLTRILLEDENISCWDHKVEALLNGQWSFKKFLDQCPLYKN